MNLPWGMVVIGLLPLFYLLMKKEKKMMETSLESIRFVRTGESVREQATKREAAILAEIAADEAKIADRRKLAEEKKAAFEADPTTPPLNPSNPLLAGLGGVHDYFSKGASDDSMVLASIARKRDAANALNTLARNIDVAEKYQLSFIELVFIGY